MKASLTTTRSQRDSSSLSRTFCDEIYLREGRFSSSLEKIINLVIKARIQDPKSGPPRKGKAATFSTTSLPLCPSRVLSLLPGCDIGTLRIPLHNGSENSAATTGR